MKYGTPYMGSKSGIAEWVVSLLPPAENLYDLFAGGCAVTHCALLSGKYSHIHANDIGDAPKMFLDAVNGKYSHMTRWVSRGEFYAEKDGDPYVKWCWSFGNNGRDYMYSRKIEAAKHALHMLVFFNDNAEYKALTGLEPDLKGSTPYERYADYHRFYSEHFGKRGEYSECQSAEAQARRASLDKLQSLLKFKRLCGAESIAEYSRLKSAEASLRLESLERTRQRAALGIDRIQSLSRLCQLESLDSVKELETIERQERQASLERPCGKQLESAERTRRLAVLEDNKIPQDTLTVTKSDYRDVEIKPNSVVYADIPYFSTNDYTGKSKYSKAGDGGFDHEAFCGWVKRQKSLVIVSEYTMPDDFVCVGSKRKMQTMCATKTTERTEKMFVHKSQIDMYREMMDERKVANGGLWLFPEMMSA